MFSLAHVRWFVTEGVETTTASWSELSIIAGATILGLAILFMVTRLSWLKKFEKKLIKPLTSLRRWVPVVFRYIIGLGLLINAFNGYFFAPNLEVDPGGLEALVSWLGAGLGLFLIAGIFVRASSLLLMALFIFSFTQVSPLLLVEHLEYFAIPLYLAINGGGMLSLDKFDLHLLGHLKKISGYLTVALVGVSFTVLALSEKLLNLPLAESFLRIHHWNFLATFGVSDHWFILVVGTTELIIGLALVAGWLNRLLLAATLGLMTLTAILLGPVEVTGHLFIIGLIMLTWTTDTSFSLKYLPFAKKNSR